MVARAKEHLEGAIIEPYTVASGQSVTKGKAVILSSGNVQDAAAIGANAIGIALNSGAAGETVRIALFGYGVAKVLVGTNGITAGEFVKYEADGGTDATIGGATTKLVCWGQALETGVAGDFVGVNLGKAGPTVGS